MLIRELTPNARTLLAKLGDGSNVADAPANVGAFAYSTLARAFLSNARRLCLDDHMSDFRVYGALYSMRHGLELLLKCIARNDLIDTMLRSVMTIGQPFGDVCTSLKLERKTKTSFQQALCTMRNILEDGITFPDCRTKNIDLPSTERALEFLRKNPDLPRRLGYRVISGRPKGWWVECQTLGVEGGNGRFSKESHRVRRAVWHGGGVCGVRAKKEMAQWVSLQSVWRERSVAGADAAC